MIAWSKENERNLYFLYSVDLLRFLSYFLSSYPRNTTLHFSKIKQRNNKYRNDDDEWTYKFNSLNSYMFFYELHYKLYKKQTNKTSIIDTTIQLS